MKSELKVQFKCNSRLPKLAWCAELIARSRTAVIEHGEWVETGDWGFCEGVWAGDFSEVKFDEEVMCGTGGKLSQQGLLFVTPNHTIDRLVLTRRNDRILLSNSLPFVLAMSSDELDSNFLFYDSYMASIKFGLKEFRHEIPTKSGAAIRFLYYCNLLVDNEFNLRIIKKKPSPSFSTYEQYDAYLEETVQRIVRNAAATMRKQKFVPLASVSRGYDSTAAMVIAHRAGCVEAVTFRESRGTVAGEDCGTVIAECIGIESREFDRLAYRSRGDFPESLTCGGPTEFLSLGNALVGRLFFTGFGGDNVWDRSPGVVSTNLIRSGAGGHSLTEMRLEVGFSHVPVPFIGADRHPEINKISKSKEMNAWTLGNSYDRPIARRIVEEAGVPRELFGQRKRAVGVVVTQEGLRETMSSESFREFDTFLARIWSTRVACRMAVMKSLLKFMRWNERVASLVSRIGPRIGISFIRLPILLPHRLRVLLCGYLGKEAYLFHWGVGRRISRYKDSR